jgi:hypothetical protein
MMNTTQTVSFHVGTHKQFQQDPLIVMSEQEFTNTSPEDFPANYNWQHVTVASEEDKAAWIAARQVWLDAVWTPNQTSEERAENAQIMRECEAEMERLAIQ